MYFIIKLEGGDTIPVTINKNDPTDEEILDLFRRSIPSFSELKRYVAMNHVGDCIVYERGIIYRMSDSG